MNIKILKYIKELVEISVVNNKIKNFSVEEKKNLNKIINFALTWWLQKIPEIRSNNCGGNSFANFYANIGKQSLTEEEIDQLEGFKYNFGIYLLKKMVLTNEDIILRCGLEPEGILGIIIEKSKCEFLNLYFPRKSTMIFNKQKIWIKEWDIKLLAFDVNQKIPFKTFEKKDTYTSEKLTEEEQTKKLLDEIDDIISIIMESEKNGEFILPNGFTPTTYDYVSIFLDDSNNLINNHVKKHSR